MADRLYLHTICEECAAPLFKPGLRRPEPERRCCKCGKPTPVRIEYRADKKNFNHCGCADVRHDSTTS